MGVTSWWDSSSCRVVLSGSGGGRPTPPTATITGPQTCSGLRWSGFWQLIREAHLVTMVGDPMLTRNKLVVGVSCCPRLGVLGLTYRPACPGFHRPRPQLWGSCNPSSRCFLLLYLVFVFVFVLRTKGNLYCLKGYALVPVTLNGKSGYLHCALNIFIGATVFLNYFIAYLQPASPWKP